MKTAICLMSMISVFVLLPGCGRSEDTEGTVQEEITVEARPVIRAVARESVDAQGKGATAVQERVADVATVSTEAMKSNLREFLYSVESPRKKKSAAIARLEKITIDMTDDASIASGVFEIVCVPTTAGTYMKKLDMLSNCFVRARAPGRKIVTLVEMGLTADAMSDSERAAEFFEMCRDYAHAGDTAYAKYVYSLGQASDTYATLMRSEDLERAGEVLREFGDENALAFYYPAAIKWCANAGWNERIDVLREEAQRTLTPELARRVDEQAEFWKTHAESLPGPLSKEFAKAKCEYDYCRKMHRPSRDAREAMMSAYRRMKKDGSKSQ